MTVASSRQQGAHLCGSQEIVFSLETKGYDNGRIPSFTGQVLAYRGLMRDSSPDKRIIDVDTLVQVMSAACTQCCIPNSHASPYLNHSL